MFSWFPPKVDELEEPPVVGKAYMVPSVRRGYVYVPVYGPAHADAEFGVDELHYHVDMRFISRGDASEIGLNFADHKVPFYYTRPSQFTMASIAAVLGEAVQHRYMKCLRCEQDYRTPRVDPGGETVFLWVGSLEQTGCIEDQCENLRVTECGKCPHRGTPLGHQPAENGIVVCPAHLLKWEKSTGRMIRKTKKVGEEYVLIVEE